MSKRLTLFVSVLFGVVLLVLCFVLLKPQSEKKDDFDAFISAYEQMIESDTLLNDYKEKTISYDSVYSLNDIKMIETSAFCSAVGENFVLIKQNYSLNTLSIGELKTGYALKNSESETFEVEGVFFEDGKEFLPLESVSKTLGYSLSFNEENISITKNFETKRLIVYSNEKLNSCGAIKVAENYSNIHIFEYKTEKQTQEAYNYFKNLKTVSNVEVDSIVKTEAQTYGINDSFSYSTWGAEAMNVSAYSTHLLENRQESELNTVYVAVLDTGVDTDHSWLTSRIAYDLGKNYTSSKSSTSYEFEDVFGHGTHVSGTIVDLTLKNVKIIPIKVMNDNGYGYTSGILAGIEYVTNLKKNQNINIVAMNMSLGSEISVSSSEYNSYKNAIEKAYNQNILTIAAAGNEGVDAKNSSPANVEKAITVAAVAQSGNTYSHPTWSNYGSYVDVSAPGSAIYSAKCGGGITSMSGTSMAAPHISACVALLRSDASKNYSLSDIERILTTNVVDLGDEGKDDYFGYGMVDLEYAYTTLLSNVIFSNNESSCYESFYLSLTHSQTNAKIYYTTDGTTPSQTNGLLYSEPIFINSSTKVQAIAYIFNGQNVEAFSRISEMTYYFSDIDVAENYVVENGVLTSYNGSLTHLIVPSYINGQTITAIGENVFYMSDVISVSLADTIVEIKSSAFYGATSLENIYAKSVKTIGDQAFYNCISLEKLNEQNFKELTFIGKQSFYNCVNISSIYLPKLEFVDYQAFNMASLQTSSLSSVNLPSVLTIAEEAFVYCDSLNEVILPNVQTICSDAFYECSISSISLPEVKNLGNYAFYKNSALTQISIPKAEIISSYCFYETNLTDISADNVTFVGKYAFYNCQKLETVSFKNLKTVGVWAFAYCEKLNAICLDEVLEIGSYAFFGCGKLESINLKKTLKLESYAFGLSGLKTVKTSQNLNQCGYNAFYEVDKSCEFYIFPQTPIKDYLDTNKYSYFDLSDTLPLFSYKIYQNEVYILGYNSSGEVIIPSYINGLKVTKICDNAFLNCENIEVLNCSYVFEIGENAFKNCNNLKYINLDSIQIIRQNAFFGCENLSYVNLESASVIEEQAFFNCPKLLSVCVSKNILEIGDRAFAYLDKDEGVYQMVSTFVLYGYGDVASGYVEEVNLQKDMGLVNSKISFLQNYTVLTKDDFSYTIVSSTGIKIGVVSNNLSGNIIIPQTILDDNNSVLTITQIGNLSFDDCSFIENIVLPSSVKILGEGAFKNCSRIKSINLENITQIGNNCFEGCDSLLKVNLSGLTTISEKAFLDCGALESVYAPEAVVVYEECFENCFSLTNVYLPKAKQIYAYGFYGCHSLKTISLNSVVYLGTLGQFSSIDQGGVFYNCYLLETIYLDSIQIICTNSFYNTNLTEVILGNKINTISRFRSTVSNFNENMTIYGYINTTAQLVARNVGATFVPLDEFEVSIDEELTFAQNSQAEIVALTTGKGETYEWYKTLDNIQNGVKIDGQTDKSLFVDSSVCGTFFYFVKVTNFNGEQAVSNISKVEIKEAYTVEVSVVGNGVVNPCEDIFGLNGETQKFLISPQTGYYTKQITINGINIDEQELLNLKDGGELVLAINSNTELEVEFEIYKFNLIINSSSHGIASLNKTVVEWGSEAEISFVLDSGYGIEYVLIDGEKSLLSDDVLTNLKYEIKNIKKDLEIYVSFNNKFTISTLCNENGNISATQTADFGQSVTITIQPNSGFYVSDVVIDGQKLSEEEITIINQTHSYTFSDVKTEHQISAFYSSQSFKISYEITSGKGSLSFDSSPENIKYGESRMIILEPNNGYVIKAVYVNGKKVKLKNNTYTIENITSDIDVKVEFVESSNQGVSTGTILTVIICGGLILIVCFVMCFRFFKRQ